MAFSCSQGSTYLLNGHLWVIISDPVGEPEQVIVVFLTSQKPSSDCTVILSPGDHDFITRPTVISYGDSRIQKISHIMQRVEERDYEPRERFSFDLTKIIRQGLIDSPFTPRYIRQFFNDSLKADQSNSN